MLVCLIALVMIRRTCVDSNDDAFGDDPEDSDYEEEPVEEFEGKSYRPSLIMLNPDFANIKYDQQLNRTFIACMV